jgi:hypothetical protein
MSDFEKYVGKVVKLGVSQFEVLRQEGPSKEFPEGREYTTKHDHHPAVLMSVDDDGIADLKIMKIGGKGIERKRSVPFAQSPTVGAWSPE